MWDLFNYSVYCFKDEATEAMLAIRDFHDFVLFYLILILVFVTYLLFYLSNHYNSHKSVDLNHNAMLEFIWTIIPAFILVIIGIPSFKLLYNMDEVLDPLITLRVTGNQWFWDYSILDVSLSSYMKEDYKLFKYLETDNPIYLPILTPIRVITTSSDVIHCWSVPSFGIKVDSIPGRLNQALLYILKKGLYFGACYDICGVGHSLMAVEIYGVDNLEFEYWLSCNKE